MKKKYITLLFVFLLKITFSQTSQSATIDSLKILHGTNALLDVSSSLIDRQLFQLNVRVEAPIRFINPETITFYTIFNIDENRALTYSNRLVSTYSFLQSVVFNSITEKLVVTFHQAPSQEQINLIVSHFSYQGHEVY
jgi:hypothetical protein